MNQVFFADSISVSRKSTLNFGLLLAFFWMVLWGGCSTTEVTPVLPVDPPDYTQVPHPEGSDLNDISVLFMDKRAPMMPEFALNCDHDFRKLISFTQSLQELQQGYRELVKSDPVRLHWCFYGKLLKLEGDLKTEAYVEERQKKVLETFEFIAPIARAFISEFHDSRYLRCAVYRYRKISEWVFYRRLDVTPQGTYELVQPTNVFGLWRKTDGDFAILNKYLINVESSPLISNPGVSTSPIPYVSVAPLVVPSGGPSVLPAEPLPLAQPSVAVPLDPLTHS